MDAASPARLRKKSAPGMFRRLRPLWVWALLALLLFGWRKHQELSRNTRLVFSATMNGAPALEAEASVDGRRLMSGERVPVGWHDFSVWHPKAGTFSKQVFVKYGTNELGEIMLERSTGELTLQTEPPARLLIIEGPEFQEVLTNSTGQTLRVPTDRYEVTAQYENWQKTEAVEVSRFGANSVRFAPPFGALKLSASHPGAVFELSISNKVLRGEFPAELGELPEGSHRLVAQRRGSEQEAVVEIKAKTTNELKVEFVYGAAQFLTEPGGAKVLGRDGREIGQTPLLLAELEPGKWDFVLRREGFEPVPLLLAIAGGTTNLISTNLVSSTYAGAMNAARREYVSGNFALALEAATEALRINPGDSAALELKRSAFREENLRLAIVLGSSGDFTEGAAKLQLVLETFPEHAKAKKLLEEFHNRAQNQQEQARADWLKRGEALMDLVSKRHDGGDLFGRVELKSAKPLAEAEAAILRELEAGDPVFQVRKLTGSVPEAFVLEASFDAPLLSLKLGHRKCLVVGARTGENETQILFKVLDYKVEHKFPEGASFGTPATITLIPVHPSRMERISGVYRSQLEKGEADITARIKRALSP